jgi:tRNA(Ile)-lysidine synthase
LHPAVLRWLGAEGNSSGRLAVALSGGADSVALLLLLWAHFPERRKRLLALHFDHRLRGRASTEDARFCVRLCAALGVELAVGRWENPPPTPSEGAARAARREFFTATLRRRRVAALCTGHHRDDVAETFFMRLARGAGASGLSAPRPVHAQTSLGRVHLRPLLNLEKTLLTGGLRAAGGTWREDASNFSSVHLRNRVRAELVPAWRGAAAEPGRDALGGIALARELLEEDDVALEDWAERATRIDSRGGLALAPLRDLPRAVLRRVVHRWLATTPARTDLNRVGFNALLDLVSASGRTGAKHSLGSAHFAVRGRARLVCVAVGDVPR